MEALVERLTQLDSSSEGALRVVTFFDTLMRRRVDVPGLARAAAGLSECVIGVRLHDRDSESTRVSPAGTTLPGWGSDVATPTPIVLDDEEIGIVWLERLGEARALDSLVLDRLAIAVAATVERYGLTGTAITDPALVELAIAGHVDEATRARALRLLGLSPERPVHVAAVRGVDLVRQVADAVCVRPPVRTAQFSGLGAILACAVDPQAFPPGVQAGISRAPSADVAWKQAQRALRFAYAGQPVVEYHELGAFTLLAEVPARTLAANPDVVLVARLHDDRQADVETLMSYCATGSIRRAGELLHLHHSSVARRLEQVSSVLGFDVTQPHGMTRATAALHAWRLARTAPM